MWNVTGANCTGGLAGWAQVQLDQEDMSKNVANLDRQLHGFRQCIRR